MPTITDFRTKFADLYKQVLSSEDPVPIVRKSVTIFELTPYDSEVIDGSTFDVNATEAQRNTLGVLHKAYDEKAHALLYYQDEVEPVVLSLTEDFEPEQRDRLSDQSTLKEVSVIDRSSKVRPAVRRPRSNGSVSHQLVAPSVVQSVPVQQQHSAEVGVFAATMKRRFEPVRPAAIGEPIAIFQDGTVVHLCTELPMMSVPIVRKMPGVVGTMDVFMVWGVVLVDRMGQVVAPAGRMHGQPFYYSNERPSNTYVAQGPAYEEGTYVFLRAVGR